MRLLPALALPLLLLSPVSAQQQQPPPVDLAAARAELLAFVEALSTTERETVQVGGLEVQVTVVPEYFLYLAARELLRLEATTADAAREHLRRFAERQRRFVGRAGVVLRFVHATASDRDFYCFEGDLTDQVRVQALQGIQVSGVSTDGPIQRRVMTLFKAQRTGLFGANVPPVLERTYMVFGREPFTVELVTRRELGDRARTIEVRLAPFVHFSGNIAGNQADFEHGAVIAMERGPAATFQMPLRMPEVPAALTALLPPPRD